MSKRFLVVTGDKDEAMRLQRVLASSNGGGTSVDWAATLAEALTMLAERPADLLLLECYLDDSTGLATFDALNAAAPRTPILTLHDEANDCFTTETIERGARGFLVKNSYESYLLPQAISSILSQDAAEKRFENHRARAEITLNSIEDAVISTGADGCIDYLNEAAGKLCGWTLNDAVGRPVREVLQFHNKDTLQPIRNPLETVIEYNLPLRLPAGTILIRRDGSEAAIENSSAPIRDASGKLAGAVIVFHDVSAAQEMVKQMAYLATHDFLTDLPNRSMLEDRIAQAIAHAERDGGQVAVLYLDLDNFKHVNDSLGHPTGDKLLCSVARRLRDCVRASDTVSRQGGDEFVILVPGSASQGQAATTADKVLAALTEPHCIGEHELHITASIGISTYPDDGADAVSLLKNADTAMYIAKQNGRNNRQFFELGMNHRAVERQLVESNLRRALERQEFLLHYQPKIELSSGSVTGAEALIRWQHPDWGMVAPERFIRVAEDFGLIVQMGRWVLGQACLQAKRWQDAGIALQTIAVNVSAVELRSAFFVEGVREALQAAGLDPACLELEITESVLMYDVERSGAILQQLKDMGVRLAVDDFGTGYSSLSYLKLFPIDVLKIDKSFVSGIGALGDDGRIASAVIAMGNSLKFRVVAEGVEDQFQLDFLRRHHCDDGQGFFFSEAMTSGDFEKMVAARAALAN